MDFSPPAATVFREIGGLSDMIDRLKLEVQAAPAATEALRQAVLRPCRLTPLAAVPLQLPAAQQVQRAFPMTISSKDAFQSRVQADHVDSP